MALLNHILGSAPSQQQWGGAAEQQQGAASGAQHCVRLLDSFEHTGPHGTHICEVFESLGDDLLTLIKCACLPACWVLGGDECLSLWATISGPPGVGPCCLFYYCSVRWGGHELRELRLFPVSPPPPAAPPLTSPLPPSPPIPQGVQLQGRPAERGAPPGPPDAVSTRLPARRLPSHPHGWVALGWFWTPLCVALINEPPPAAPPAALPPVAPSCHPTCFPSSGCLTSCHPTCCPTCHPLQT